VNRRPNGMTTYSTPKPHCARRLGLLAALLLATCAAPGARSQESMPVEPTKEIASPAPAIAEAQRLVEAKRLDQATLVLRAYLEREPSDRAARSMLARLLSWDSRYDESITEYERLLSVHPESASDRAGYARVLAWSGRIEQALVEFQRALAADSTDVETRVAYARAISWIGDLPGAAKEYHRILSTHPDNGDAWLGYATVARWRGGATASDRFLSQAAAHGADGTAMEEERAAVRRALAPGLGGGWTSAQERQYVAGPDFTLRSRGLFTSGRVTIGRTADLTTRAAWLEQSERAESGLLNYDMNARLIRADLALLRGYPFQAAAGIESRRLTPGTPAATYPLPAAGHFLGWNARSWFFLGRFTPAVAVRHEFVPLKSNSPVNALRLGHQTALEGTIAWQWSGRGNAETAFERGDYSDGNARTAVRAGTRYRVRIRQPAVALDYGFGYTDFDTTSSSYFTPLSSMRHAAGVGLDGYAQRFGLGYGARYQYSTLGSDNFGAIRTHTWSAHVTAADLGTIGVGIDGAYSRDNNAYEIWSIGIHAAARW
jgi:tetratricopeptide (TPR) repeat protein